MATKWGVASAGKISHDFVTAVRSLPGNDHKFVAVGARSLDSAKKFADLHQIPKAYGSYEELAKDPEVEVVYIGAIHPAHYAIAKLLLNAGKHLLIEKPMTLNTKNTQELVDLARSKKLFLMEAMWSRFIPAYVFVREQLEQGVIGEVTHVQCAFGEGGLGNVERLAKKELGGGTILDLGVYPINVLLTAYKDARPEVIKATGTLNSEGCDASMAAVFRFPGDKTASISTSMLSTLTNEAHIFGTKGTIKILAPMWCSESVEVNGKRHDFPMPPTVLDCNFTNSSGLRYEAQEVRRCLKEGLLESPINPLSATLLAANITDELRKQVGVVYDADK